MIVWYILFIQRISQRKFNVYVMDCLVWVYSSLCKNEKKLIIIIRRNFITNIISTQDKYYYNLKYDQLYLEQQPSEEHYNKLSLTETNLCCEGKTIATTNL